VRVRYAETDRMGYVYYGTYAQYFEVGRVEALRSLGMSYRRMEEEGVMLPVHDLSVKYHKPAFYDDELTVRTTIPVLPGVRIKFDYEVRNAAGELLTEASTTLVFIDRATGRPCRGPKELMAKLASYFP
jgi:acyl-CoA thioester hydrolase